MLIYEKKVEENSELVRHLFGTTGHIPSDSDKQLTYTDEDGDVVTDLTVLSQLLDDGKGGIKTKAGEKILVWLDDLNIIPGNVQEGVAQLKVTTMPTKVSYIKDETLDLTGLVVKAVDFDGTVSDALVLNTDYVTEPVNGATLSDVGDAIPVTVSGKEGTDYAELSTQFTIEVETPSTECDILTFKIGTSDGVIDTDNNTIAVTVPSDTVVTALTPTITSSAGSTVSPSGEQDFTNAVTYTVTAQDGVTTKQYVVTVTLDS